MRVQLLTSFYEAATKRVVEKVVGIYGEIDGEENA